MHCVIMIHDHGKSEGPRLVFNLFSFCHNPLPHQLYCSVCYEAPIHKMAFGNSLGVIHNVLCVLRFLMVGFVKIV